MSRHSDVAEFVKIRGPCDDGLNSHESSYGRRSANSSFNSKNDRFVQRTFPNSEHRVTTRRQVALLIEMSNAYARGLLSGIHAYLREQGQWSIYLAEHGRGAAPPDWLKHWRGDGIIARVDSPAIAEAIRGKRVPTVNVSATGFLPTLPCVKNDDADIARLAFEHLRQSGFNSLAFCGDEQFPWSRERGKAFSRLARDAGCRFAAYAPAHGRQSDRGSWEKEQEQLTAWIRQLAKPCGVMACYDIRGLQLLEVCRAAGVAVPDEVAVVGVDNDELLCNLSEPPLSSVTSDSDRAGYQAASLLDRMMAGEKIIDGTYSLKPTGIVVRQSSDVLAVSDPEVSHAVRFIRDHAAEGIKVGDLLRAVPVSRRVLEARFKKLLGRSPHDEIVRIQLQRVRQLLEETDLPLKAVAERAGFKHVEYLSAAFRRHVGQPPGEYRAAHRVHAARSAP